MKIGFIISVYTEYENTMKNIHFLQNIVISRNILFPEKTFKKCATLKSPFWKCFPTENGITRLSLIRRGQLCKNVYIIRRCAQLQRGPEISKGCRWGDPTILKRARRRIWEFGRNLQNMSSEKNHETDFFSLYRPLFGVGT